MIINKNMKMADVIHLNYLLLSVINRFGIELGFGEKTVNELCIEKGINVEFFLEITNAFHDNNYSPNVHLQLFPLKNIIKYLRKTHLFYLNNTIPEIENQINSLEEKSTKNRNNIIALKSFFIKYQNELSIHIKREEEKVFPYVIELEEALINKEISNELYNKMTSYSINNYYEEHDDIEEKLFDLKNIIIKYLPLSGESEIINQLISNLFILEKDVNDHSRIEDKILVPKVAAIEDELLKLYNNKTNK